MSYIQPQHITPEDTRTRAWEHVIDDMRLRLDALRLENDSASDELTTAKRRGRIAELKEWVALAEQARPSANSPQGLMAVPFHTGAY